MSVSASSKNVLLRYIVLGAVGLYVTGLTGCHSAPPRPQETPQMQVQRKDKRGD